MSKRSVSPGCDGAQNPLFFGENAHMLFDDDRDRAGDIVKAI
jgi:NAD/NADP transhydrogenase beta subunit